MSESIFLILVIFLLLLASIDLFVGVSNDAVNFLNSAVGCRITSLRVIMVVASLGVLFGATFSSGMMEIARSGMFNPHLFTFHDVMIIFFAVMVTDVLILNLFNSLGLPTSTTVTIVFDLLGAAVAASLYKLYVDQNSLSFVFDYIKSDKAITIVSAILVSVAVAFISGALVQFIMRLLFSFKFENAYKYLGGVYTGFALTAIIYFLVMKGAKGASFMRPEYIEYINTNTSSILWTCFISLSVLGQLLIFIKFNVFKIIILSGTFALAFSFAGNDLVNFIGVPLAALESFQVWLANGAPASDSFMMHSLTENVKTPTYYLVIAGSIMVVTLWTSKKAHKVLQTSISLSSSNRGEHEQFGASTPGRIITRFGLGVSRASYKVIPAFMLAFIGRRYEKVPMVKGEIPLPFDYIRASVNLVLASILISSATSLKLPLSTTYVTFMVAMGTSFADGAWDRESAVYRISGVITVIAGWFLTGLCAFTATFLVCLSFYNFGTVAIFGMMALTIFVIIKTNFVKSKTTQTVKMVIDAKGDNQKILQVVSKSVPNFFDYNVECLNKAVANFFEDNEYQIRKARNKASNVLEEISRERSAYYSMAADRQKNEKMSKAALDAMHFFYLTFSNMREASKSVKYAIDQAVVHVANRHTIFEGRMKEIILDLTSRLEKICNDMRVIANDPTVENVETIIKHARKLNKDISKSQVELVNLIGQQTVSMHSSEMFLTFLQTIREVSSRYVAVAMQERALAQIVSGAAPTSIVQSAQEDIEDDESSETLVDKALAVDTILETETSLHAETDKDLKADDEPEDVSQAQKQDTDNK